jgi:chromosomal replication initiation ATPase DnaA
MPMRSGKTRTENERAVDFQMIVERIRARESRLASLRPPRPKNVNWGECKKSFAPDCNTFEGRWTYPGRSESGLCFSCERKMSIREHIQEHLERAAVPPKHIRCSFENFEVTKENKWVFRACKSYASNRRGNLLIYGDAVRGKRTWWLPSPEISCWQVGKWYSPPWRISLLKSKRHSETMRRALKKSWWSGI